MNITIHGYEFKIGEAEYVADELNIEVSTFRDIPATFHDPCESELEYQVIDGHDEDKKELPAKLIEFLNHEHSATDTTKLSDLVWDACCEYEPDDGH